MGAGATTLVAKGGDTKTYGGLGGLNLALGGFITPKIAVLAKISNVNYVN